MQSEYGGDEPARCFLNFCLSIVLPLCLLPPGGVVVCAVYPVNHYAGCNWLINGPSYLESCLSICVFLRGWMIIVRHLPAAASLPDQQPGTQLRVLAFL